jgi:hypothetical protein
VFSIDARTVTVTRYGTGLNPMIGAFVWAPDSKTFYMNAINFDGGGYGVFRLGLEGTRATIYRGDKAAELGAISPDGKTLGVLYAARDEEAIVVEVGTPIALQPPNTQLPPPGASSMPTAFMIRNRRAQAIELDAVDSAGAHEHRLTIPPGFTIWQDAFVGQAFAIRERLGIDLGVFVATEKSGLVVTGTGEDELLTTRLAIKPPSATVASADTGLRTSIHYKNRRAHAIDLWTIDAAGNRHAVARVMAGQTYTFGAAAGQVWVIREGTVDLGVVVATDAAGLVVIE